MLHIITDSSSEISSEEAKILGVEIVPLGISFGDEAYLEGVSISKEAFYERLPHEFPQTSQPSPDAFDEAFKRTNGEETIAILISSALSGTVSTANMAKREGNYDNVVVYDSLCTTAMLHIMVEEACKNREKSAAEVVKILDGLRPRIRLYAALDTLENLYRGGRIKKSVAVVGGLLGIKPIIAVDREGAVAMIDKAKGQKKAIAEVGELFRKEEADVNYPVYFLQTNNEDPATKLMNETGRPEARRFRICCAIGAHIGVNAVGVVYVVK